MGVYIIQNDFSRGEFSPLLAARSDLDFFMKGAKKIRNIQVIPQGGCSRRPGTIYIAEINSTIQNSQIYSFIYSETEEYLLVFYNNTLVIYQNDAVVYTNTSAPWTSAMITDLEFTQTSNLLIICHPDMITQTLVRGANSSTWTLANIAIKRFPVFDFAKNYNSLNFTLSSSGIGTGITLTCSGAIFTAEYVNGIYLGAGSSIDAPVGYARITGFIDATRVTVTITTAFGGTVASGDDVILTVPAWSATRGYPVCATFYENRLVFGGSKSLPETLFFSKIGDFYNFDIGTGDADDAIVATIATDSLNSIRHLVSNRSLQVFTSDAEFAPPQLDNSPLTPTEIGIRLQSRNGCTKVSPVSLDNATFYVRNGGKAVMAFVLNGDTQSYNSIEASVLAPHLINNPIDSATLKGSRQESANFMYIVNSDGTIACYQTLSEQNVSAWSLFETNGSFGRITSLNDKIYLLVQRSINGVNKLYLEKFDNNTYTDCAYKNTYEVATKTITGLNHLEGKVVRVRGNGYVLTSQTVFGGQITLAEDESPVTSVEVGLNFNLELEPNPVVINSPQGNYSYLKKRVSSVYLHYYESLGIKINGTLIPYLQFNSSAFEPQAPKSGIYEHLIFGTDIEPKIVITQTDPLPMTILGIGYEVEA